MPAPLLEGARALLAASGEATARAALDVLGHVGAVPDPAPLIEAALALLAPGAAPPALRVLEPGEERRAAGA